MPQRRRAAAVLLLLLSLTACAAPTRGCSFARPGRAAPDNALHRGLVAAAAVLEQSEFGAAAFPRAAESQKSGLGRGPADARRQEWTRAATTISHARAAHAAPAGTTYEVLPDPITTVNNAFVTHDLLEPLPTLSGNGKTLLENLDAFAAAHPEETEGFCYWAFQALPPPRGAAPPHWDVDSGQWDQDLEWVQAYGTVAVARLHSRISPGGPVVAAACTMGSAIASRRCANGKSNASKCVPAVANGTIRWPMAISMWKVGHPDLRTANTDWRANSATGHLPNIEWVEHTTGNAARPWSGPMPKVGEIDPPAMPDGTPSWPASQGLHWGSPKIAKVVRCAEIPDKFVYHAALYECEHLPAPDAKVSTADEMYGVWRRLQGVWPPTKPCEDDQQALDRVLTQLKIPQLVGQNCSVVFPVLQKVLPNFDCDNSDTTPTIRDMCCSQCGGRPIPDVPSPSPSPSPSPVARCAVCKHVYDPVRDGGGLAFADLPDSWRCPVCGAPKSAYRQEANGVWVHD